MSDRRVATDAYTAGIRACILLVKSRAINDTDRDLIRRMEQLLPRHIPTGEGDDWRKPL